MPNLLALNALLAGPESWKEFISGNPSRIDLALARFEGRNLADREFLNCDFAGSILDGANLDRCIFRECSFKHASLAGASLISAVVDRGDFSQAALSRAVARDTLFTTCHFGKSLCDHMIAERCLIDSCTFEEVRLHLSTIVHCEFKKLRLANSDIFTITFQDCQFSESRFTNLKMSDATLADCRFFESEIASTSFNASGLTRVQFIRCHLHAMPVHSSRLVDIDFSASTLREIDLGSVDLSKSSMFNAITIDCNWPSQSGRVNLLGKYIPSPNLLGQPVRDVRGLSAMRRREIADAQYLVELHNSVQSVSGRLLLRLWGITCSFGMSLIRLTFVTMLGIFLMAAVVRLIDSNEQEFASKTYGHCLVAHQLKRSSRPPPLRCMWNKPPTSSYSTETRSYGKEAFIVGLSVFGLDKGSATAGRDIVLPWAHVFGIIILGLWVGVAATRLGRLSSE